MGGQAVDLLRSGLGGGDLQFRCNLEYQYRGAAAELLMDPDSERLQLSGSGEVLTSGVTAPQPKKTKKLYVGHRKSV